MEWHKSSADKSERNENRTHVQASGTHKSEVIPCLLSPVGDREDAMSGHSACGAMLSQKKRGERQGFVILFPPLPTSVI